jgi:hypothetical protein
MGLIQHTHIDSHSSLIFSSHCFETLLNVFRILVEADLVQHDDQNARMSLVNLYSPERDKSRQALSGHGCGACYISAFV